MKFLVDENEHAGICAPLTMLHPAHTFEHVSAVGLAGLLDVELFAAMHARGYNALLTQDRAQIMDNLEELDALLEHGIHWIGRKQSHQPGIRSLAIATSTYVSATPDVLELVQSTESPLQVRLSNVQIGIGPRVKSSPLISFRDRLVKKAA
ncbi:hypothetical protein C0205_03140 [Micrococcus luteus]|uniref:PIN-like domain-containing protein n=1 Tax=Micrococcus luteus TaxID=1270 RepID=UPI0010FF9EF3|nr:hypothetical protein [Micrococcus luteus]AWD24243.2 hypothetical protein C0205_03140 [Micrococcus luteus]